MNFILAIFIFISSFGHSDKLHEFHVSKCLVEYKADKEEIQISMNIFIDDFELALQSMDVDSLFIGTERESEQANEFINKYLEHTFVIGINESEKSNWQFIGKEVSEDLSSIWCYMYIKTPDDIKKIYVKNGVLLETYDDQKNITNIIGPNKQKTSFLGSIGNDDKVISY